MKKLFICCFSLLFTITMSFSVYAGEIESYESLMSEQLYEGLIPTPQNILTDHLPVNNSVLLVEENDDLPLAVDNSSSSYFPIIGNQGSASSCATWAGVYYMYTYEVNRLHNTPAVVETDGVKTNILENVYSPAWTHSVMTSNSGQGMAFDWVFDFTIAHGQQTMATLPYYSDTTPYPCFPTDRNDIVEALSTRISRWDSAYIDTTTSSIANTNSIKLEEVKKLLSDGYVLGVATQVGINTKQNSLNELCVYRVYYHPIGHALTVVGYDDTVWCDINSDNIAQEAEYGAFKVANSWGNTWGNEGYCWVSYDALNKNSMVSGDWETTLSGTRYPAFCLNGEWNWFTYIQVQDYDVNYASLLEVTVNNPAYMGINLQRQSTDGSVVSEIKSYTNGASDISYNRTYLLAYDYAELSEPAEEYISNSVWSVWASNPSMTIINSCEIVDNFANTLTTCLLSNIDNKWNGTLNLILGDVNLDNRITMADVSLIMNYIVETENLSNIQTILADFNNDGIVATLDARELAIYIQNSSEIDVTAFLESIEGSDHQCANE